MFHPLPCSFGRMAFGGGNRADECRGALAVDVALRRVAHRDGRLLRRPRPARGFRGGGRFARRRRHRGNQGIRRGTITYSENLGEATYIEELIHAFQYVFGQMDDPTINKEYEARLLTMWVLGEVKTLAPSVEGCLGKYLDQIYSGRLVGIGNPELLRTEYQEYGKMFVDYFKRTYPTDANYHVPANEPSLLFISIFQFLFNKILKPCRY